MAVNPITHGLTLIWAELRELRRMIPRFSWGVVTEISPRPMVQLEADPEGTPREVTESAIGPVAVDQQVYLMIRGSRLTILAAPPPIA